MLNISKYLLQLLDDRALVDKINKALKAMVNVINDGAQIVQAVRVLDKDLTAPPASPSDGDSYIVAAGATGAWAGQDGNIASWVDVASAWTFIEVDNGVFAYVADEDAYRKYLNGVWTVLPLEALPQDLGPTDSPTFEGLTITGSFRFNNPADTFEYIFAGSAIAADRTVTLPLLTANDTFAFIGHPQTWTAKQTFNGFVVAGDSAPAIKMKKLTGTTAATEGGAAVLAHGLTASKIIACNVVLEHTVDTRYDTQGNAVEVGYEFAVRFGGSNFVVLNHPTNSENILSKPFTALLIYEE